MEDSREMDLLTAAFAIERGASHRIVTNDPEELIEKVEPSLDLGFNHLAFHAPGPDQERFLCLFSMNILPGLHRRFA